MFSCACSASMQVLRGPTRHDKDGTTRISVEIVVAPEYTPGQCYQIEADLQAKLNELAVSGMEVILSRFDTHGEPITLGGRVYTSKGRSPATYQCFGGAARVERYVYQTSEGGKTFCPLEDRARIIADTTPHFASIVAGKYSANSGRETRIDLQRSLQREVGLEYVQNLVQSVGRSALAQEKYLAYEVQLPPEVEVEAIVVAADATCVPLVKEGYKQASAGCFCLLDKEGELLDKIYLAEVPEEGKQTFWVRMERETKRLKERFPTVPWFGISDGAVDIQEWLEEHCDLVTLDFYHLSQYIIGAKEAFGLTEAEQKQWVEKTLHALKHEEGAAERLLKQLRKKVRVGVENEAAQAVVKALGYVERNRERMEYALLGEENLPIGSGVIEGACKFVIKQRACGSGMKWKRKALRSVLALRSLYVSSNRWEQFWRRCATFGY